MDNALYPRDLRNQDHSRLIVMNETDLSDAELLATRDFSFGKPVATERQIDEAFGAILRVLSQTTAKQAPVANVYARMLVPVRLNQYLILRTTHGKPAGFATWAFVDEGNAKKLAQSPGALLHFSEWNDGVKPWIMDFVVSKSSFSELAVALKAHLSDTSTELHWSRRKTNGSYHFKKSLP
jgi:hemolysin-activating ACP:hemolysin acyltransferase